VARVITALRKQSSRRRRVHVFLDEVYAFSVSEDMAADLSIGQHLREEEIAAIVRGDDLERAYRRAMRLLSRRPRSFQEIEQRLQKAHVAKATTEQVLHRLSERGLLDDRVFADTWIENRLQFRPRSAKLLRHELRAKGVQAEQIELALSGYDDELAARRAAIKQARKWKALDQAEFRRRMHSFLMRRGFDYDTVSTVIKQVWMEITGLDEESEDSK